MCRGLRISCRRGLGGMRCNPRREAGPAVRACTGAVARAMPPNSTRGGLCGPVPHAHPAWPRANALDRWRGPAGVSIRDRRSALLEPLRMARLGRGVERTGRSTHGRRAPTSCHHGVTRSVGRLFEGRQRPSLVSGCARPSARLGDREPPEDARGIRPTGDERGQRVHEPRRPDLDARWAHIRVRVP